jgi:CubicO group peptidase (beta-lactamase class C family)
LYKAILHNFADIDDNKIFASRHVLAGNPQPWTLSENYNKIHFSASLEAELEKYKSVAFLIVKDGKIEFEKYWEDYGTESLSNSFSMAKTLVGIITGVALEEGKIKSLDQPISDFLPEFKQNGKAKITIRNLLTMSSGINWDESYVNPLSITTKAYYGDNIKSLVDKLEVAEEPGKIFKYLSGNTLLLSAVLEKATGKNISEYFSEKIWKTIGAEHTAEWSLDRKDGVEKSYCCFYSNARDFAKIGQLYLNKGNWNGTQLVSEKYVEESIKPANLTLETGGKLDHFGYAWWLLPNYKSHNIFYARGILGQYIFVIPEKKIVVVRLGKKRGTKIGEHYSDVYKYIDEVLKMYPDEA